MQIPGYWMGKAYTAFVLSTGIPKVYLLIQVSSKRRFSRAHRGQETWSCSGRSSLMREKINTTIQKTGCLASSIFRQNPLLMCFRNFWGFFPEILTNSRRLPIDTNFPQTHVASIFPFFFFFLQNSQSQKKNHWKSDWHPVTLTSPHLRDAQCVLSRSPRAKSLLHGDRGNFSKLRVPYHEWGNFFFVLKEFFFVCNKSWGFPKIKMRCVTHSIGWPSNRETKTYIQGEVSFMVHVFFRLRWTRKSVETKTTGKSESKVDGRTIF